MLRIRNSGILRFFTQIKYFRMSNISNMNKNNNTEKDKEETETQLPMEPTNCCMSGCDNCVWKQYALDLIELYHHSNEDAKKVILEKIRDPTMQVFLKLELQFLEDKKK